MAHKLPDELLKAILSPPLRVADHRFADLGPVSPFSKVTRSSSSVLLVCKRWMRVATLCLYEFVVLRSTAQACAFGMALTRNPEFGLFVRHLRLEASYSKYLTTKIISTMPAIRSLCIPIGVMSSERGRDIHDLLAIDSVERLLLIDCRPHRANASRTALLAKIDEQLLKWENLTQFKCTQITWSDIGDKIITALSSSKSITTIRISEVAHDRGPEPYQALLAISAIRLLSFSSTDKPRGLNPAAWKKTPSAAGRVVFKWAGGSLRFKCKPPPQVAAAVSAPFAVEEAANPFWHPMESTTRDIRISIWHHILTFALQASNKSVTRFGGPWFDVATIKIEAARRALFVSHEFYEATIRALFVHLRPRTITDYAQILLHMSRDPVLASLPRSLWMTPHSSDSYDMTDRVISTFSSLKYLTTLRISSWPLPDQEALRWYQELGLAVGHSLRSFYFAPSDRSVSKMINPVVLFSNLVVLEELYWSTFHVSFEDTRMLAGSRGLSQLRNLCVVDFHDTFFNFFASIRLPHLTNLNLSHSIEKAQSFLLRNSDNIRRLEAPSLDQSQLDALKKLQVLVLPTSMPTNFFQLSNSSLFKIKISSSTSFGMRHGDEGLRSKLSKLSEHAANFPNLREIILVSNKNIWPTNERDEKKNAWTPIAESLTEMNISLKDGNGRGWRKRLAIPSATVTRSRRNGQVDS